MTPLDRRELHRASEWLEVARSAASAASALLRDAQPQHVRPKGNPRDLVTEWDVRSEELIRRVLAEHAPGVAVLGEEGGEQGGDGRGGPRWIVDPIDGTVNFAHGMPLWAVSIGLEDDTAAGRAVVAGVVVAPRLGWWFEATLGGGARDGEGRAMRVSATARVADALLVTGFPYDRATRADNNFAEWIHFQRRASACRRLGAASLDLCMVANGWMDGYWERSLKPWDIAAGALIAAEAGGRVTGWTGRPVDLYDGNVVATNGAIHEEVVAELARVSPLPTEAP